MTWRALCEVHVLCACGMYPQHLGLFESAQAHKALHGQCRLPVPWLVEYRLFV
jgi:hypothetical protein